MNYKPAILAIFFVLILSFGSALSIETQNSFSEGTQWSFIANFDSLANGDNGEILISNELMMGVFKYNNQLYVDDSFISSKIVSYKLNGNSVTISVVGYPEGVIDILLKRLNNGSIVNEVQESIEFVKLFGRTEQDALKVEVNTLQSKVNTLEENLILKDSQISSLEMENSKLLDDIQTLQSTIRLLEQDGKSNEEIISQVKEDLDILLIEREEAKKSPLNGLFVFGAENSSILFVGLLLIILVVVGIFIKTRKTSIYDSPIFDDAGDLDYSQALTAKKSNSIFDFFSNKSSKKVKEEINNEDGSKKAKWATESYFPEKNIKSDSEDKKFELGDLIKK